MRKTLGILSGILIGIFVVLTLTDHSEYKIEKKLWQMQRQYDAVAQDPAVVPGKRFDDIAAQYQAIIDKYPSASMIPKVRLQQARVYLLKKDFQRVFRVINGFLERYSGDPELSAQALLLLSGAYEAQQDESKTLSIFKRIVEEYPLTPTGLNVPLYIAEYYIRLNRPEDAARALNDAALNYRNLLARRLTSREQFFVLRYLGLVYSAKQDWDSALNVFGMALQVYGGTKDYIPNTVVLQVIRTLNTIAVSEFKNAEKLAVIYENFVSMYPRHPLNSHLKEVIAGLKQLKTGNQTGQREDHDADAL